MVRITYGAPRHKKKARKFKLARGYHMGRHKLWRTVQETLIRAWAYAFRDRRQKKRQFRRLWIVRINAATRMRGMRYSEFMDGLKKADIRLNRKALADVALNDPAAFDAILAEAKTARTRSERSARSE
jgi:large subunit ribosomal protein L20